MIVIINRQIKQLLQQSNIFKNILKYVSMWENQKKAVFFFSECMLFFGENCQYQCNLNCINQTCDKINGNCLHGCKNGYQCDRGILLSREGANISITIVLVYTILFFFQTKYQNCYQHFFLDTLTSISLPSSSLNNLPILVGGIVGACVLIIIGVVLAIFAIW